MALGQPVREEQDEAGDYQRAGNHDGIGKQLVDRVLQQHHDKQRQGGNDDEHDHPPGGRRGHAGILPAHQSGNPQEELPDHVRNVPPIDHAHRNQRAEVELDGKKHVLLFHVLHTEKGLEQGQMAGTGNGQKLRQPLYQSQKYSSPI